MGVVVSSGPVRTQSRLLMKFFGFLFAGAILAISATMNWKFGYGLSPDETERQLFGLASLAVDGLKATLPLFIIFLWRARHIGMTVIAVVLWALCFSWSMASAIGFSASTRAEAFAGKTGQIETRNALTQRSGELKQQLAALPAHRVSTVVKAELDTVDVPVAVWRRTNGCTDFTREDSRQLCQNALALRRELAASEEAGKLNAELADVQKRLGNFAGIVADADPQVHTLAQVTNISPETVKLGLVLLLATLVEVASAFGMTVVSLATSRETMLRIEARLARTMAHKELTAGTVQGTAERAPAMREPPASSSATVVAANPAAPHAAGSNGATQGQRNGSHVGLVPVAEPQPAATPAPSAEVRVINGGAANQDADRTNGIRQVTSSWVTPNRGW
jgi:hypothetical protein